MKTVLVQGATGGIGLAFVRHLLRRSDVARVFATYRSADRAEPLRSLMETADGRLHLVSCDITDEGSLSALAAEVGKHTERLHLLINASGVLHDGHGGGPERRLEHVDPIQLQHVFAVNAFGPLLVVKHLHPFLKHDEAAVVVHLSARVGSIGDNKLGGWYAYRASKAALNQFVRGMAVELKRNNRKSVCVAMHPGTVDTPLTKPFQRSAKVLFTPDDAVTRMMTVVDGLDPADSGGFFAYDGSTIEW